MPFLLPVCGDTWALSIVPTLIFKCMTFDFLSPKKRVKFSVTVKTKWATHWWCCRSVIYIVLIGLVYITLNLKNNISIMCRNSGFYSPGQHIIIGIRTYSAAKFLTKNNLLFNACFISDWYFISFLIVSSMILDMYCMSTLPADQLLNINLKLTGL